MEDVKTIIWYKTKITPREHDDTSFSEIKNYTIYKTEIKTQSCKNDITQTHPSINLNKLKLKYLENLNV